MAVGHTQKISYQQLLVEDSSVFSIQWSVFPAEIAANLTPETLKMRYLAYIRRGTFSLIRPMVSLNGVEFRLLGTGLSLISFLPPVTENRAVLLQICGGMLVQPRQCNRGELRFEVEKVENGIKVSLQLSEFCPLILGNSKPSFIRRGLYRITQAAIHRLVTIRFLVLLYRDLAGTTAPVQVINVKVRGGQPI